MAEKQNIPEIRFEGFTDPWEQRKLGELYSLVSEKNDLTFGRESIISVANMYFNANVNVTDEQYLRTYNVMRLGDIAFEGHSNKEFSHGRFVENYIGDGIVSHIFTVLRPRVPFDVNYWRYAINNEKLMRLSLIRSTKASTMMHDLVPSDFLREAIPTPTLAEQKEIGAFLVGLDHLITLHQRKYDKLCTVKKSMLDKMFPKPGETEPEIRFEGFTDPWEQRKLGSIAASFDYGLNAAATEYDGQNKYLRITDIDDTTHEFLKSDLTTPLADLAMSADYLLEEGDLLFARTGASVGKTYLYRQYDGTVYFAGFLIRARIGESADPEFVYQATLTDAYKKYVAITSQRSGQPGVNAQEYADYQLMLPSRTEQQQIGMTLRSLDNLITLHQRKLELLRNIKKSLLDRMFV